MLIVCAGRSRSGSTLLYNLVRLTLVELFGKKNVYGRGVNFYRIREEKKYNVIKLHDSPVEHFEKDADYVFSSERNERDQRKSIIAYKRIILNKQLNKKQLDQFIKYDLKRYKKWSSHKNFVKTFKYDDLVKNKGKVIREICEAIGQKLSKKQIKNVIKEVNNLRLPSKEKNRDPESALSWHHITGGSS